MNKTEKIKAINDLYKSLVIRDSETDYSDKGNDYSDLEFHSFTPKWEEWNYKPSASFSALSELSLGLEPRSKYTITRMINRLTKNCNDNYVSGLNYSIDEIIDLVNTAKELEEEVSARERIVGNHISEGLLKISRVESTRSINFQSSTNYVLFSDFVDWLKKLGLDYPSDLDNCYREENYIDTSKELSDTRKVLAMVIDIAKSKGLTQDALSSSIDELSEYKNNGIRKRRVNGIFSNCKKELGNH